MSLSLSLSCSSCLRKLIFFTFTFVSGRTRGSRRGRKEERRRRKWKLETLISHTVFFSLSSITFLWSVILDLVLILSVSVLMPSVDPFAKKDWYDIKAPSMFTVRNVGKTLVTRTQGTKVCNIFSSDFWKFNLLPFLLLFVNLHVRMLVVESVVLGFVWLPFP